MKLLLFFLVATVAVQAAPRNFLESLLSLGSDVEDPGEEPQNIGNVIFGSVASRLYETGYGEFANEHCQYSITPSFEGLKLLFAATFKCPTINRIIGKARGSGPSGSVMDATRDYAQKSYAAGHITKEQAGMWLSS